MTKDDRPLIETLERRSTPRGATRMIDDVHTGLAVRRTRRRWASLTLAVLLFGVGVITVVESRAEPPPDLDTITPPDVPSTTALSTTAPSTTVPSTTVPDSGERVVVPDVAMLSLAEALDVLSATEFLVEFPLIREDSEVAPDGRVVRTEPAAGALVTPGASIRIVIADSGLEIPVPNVVDLFFDTAEASLRNLGFTPVPEFRTVPFGDPRVGVVIEQTPDAFTVIPLGAEVRVVVGEAGVAPSD